MPLRRDDVDGRGDRPELSRGNGRTFVALALAAAIPVLLLSACVATNCDTGVTMIG